MAAETDIIRLLFNIHGVRSLYQRYVAGDNPVSGISDFSQRLGELFPAAPLSQRIEVAQRILDIAHAGTMATDQFRAIQAEAGLNWPEGVVQGRVTGSMYQVGFQELDRMQGFSVPGAPTARYAANAVVRIGTTQANGEQRTRTVQFLMAFDEQPTYAEMMESILENVEFIVGPGRYNETFTIDTISGMPSLDVGITMLIVM